MASDSDEKQNTTTAEAPRGGFGRGRKFAISLNTLVVILLAAAIVGMVNYLSIRHYKRLDWTKARYYSLSDKTGELIRSLKEPVQAIVFFQPTQPIYEDVRNLLKEYQGLSAQFSVDYIDPDRNFARVEEVTKEYDIYEPNGVVFVRGKGASKRSKYVKSGEIVEMDLRGGMFGGPPRMKAFKGELAFTSAIQELLEEKQPTVYFLTGHGERDPEDFDQRNGYSSVAASLKRENLKIEKLNLSLTNAIPAEDSVVVIAGPSVSIPPETQDILGRYLENKGRMMVLLDARKESGLDGFLGRWGVSLHNDIVVGYVSILGLASELTANAIAQEYSKHPIVQKMAGKNTTFPLARSLRLDDSPSPAPDRPRAAWLARTHRSFWGETNLAGLDDVKFDKNADHEGPLVVAAAVESGNLPGTAVDLPSTRLIVFGSSGFVANGAMSDANLDLFLGSINWLIGERTGRVLGISPKEPREFSLTLDDAQQQTLKLIVVFGMPGAVALIGAAVWWRRRK